MPARAARRSRHILRHVGVGGLASTPAQLDRLRAGPPQAAHRHGSKFRLGRLYVTIAWLHVQRDGTSNVIDAGGRAPLDTTHRPCFAQGGCPARSAASISDLPNPSKSRLNAVPIPSFPKRNHEHAGREADKRSGEDVTEKMIITDDEATGHSRDHRRVNRSVFGIIDPKNGDQCRNRSLRWSRLSGQIFRVDKWSVCRG
jgi:hypothetical protein